jgi:hypothetical protein
MLYMLDENNQAVLVEDPMAWAEWFTPERRQVAFTALPDVAISTVFLGCALPGAPLFESLCVRTGESSGVYLYMDYDDALLGHQALTKALCPSATLEHHL